MTALDLIKNVLPTIRRGETIKLIPKHLRVPASRRKPMSGKEVYMRKLDTLNNDATTALETIQARITRVQDFIESAERPERRVEIV